MPYEELVKWVDFFKSRPVGWREDQRTFMLLKAQGVKSSAQELFPTLKFMKMYEENKQIPDQAVPKGKFLELMMKAKNGDESGWNPDFVRK